MWPRMMVANSCRPWNLPTNVSKTWTPHCWWQSQNFNHDKPCSNPTCQANSLHFGWSKLLLVGAFLYFIFSLTLYLGVFIVLQNGKTAVRPFFVKTSYDGRVQKVLPPTPALMRLARGKSLLAIKNLWKTIGSYDKMWWQKVAKSLRIIHTFIWDLYRDVLGQIVSI